MKKQFCLMIFFILIIIILTTACNFNSSLRSKYDSQNLQDTTLIDLNMPEPFENTIRDSGGENEISYYSPCNHKLDQITSNLTKLVDQDEFNKWCDVKKISNKAPTKLTDYLNLYSFVVDFNISNDILKEVLVDERDFFQSLNWYDDSYDYHYTDDEIEILCSKDESKIMEHFASKYSIVNNGKIYSPQWIYTHTIQAYEAEEIPPELIEEKMELYKDIPFSPKALDALEKKLNSYIKMDLSFDKATKETVSETSASETSTETTSETNLETSVSE